MFSIVPTGAAGHDDHRCLFIRLSWQSPLAAIASIYLASNLLGT